MPPGGVFQRHLRRRGGVAQGFAADLDGVVRDGWRFIHFAAHGGSGARRCVSVGDMFVSAQAGF